MKKGTLIFRMIISALLGLAIFLLVFVSISFFKFRDEHECSTTIIAPDTDPITEEFGITVAGITVTSENASDILGDGKVSYDKASNRLTFDNVVLESETYLIRSQKDLTLNLIGENKLTGKGEKGCFGIFVSDYMNRKDFAIVGDGSLELVIDNPTGVSTAGIVADRIWAESNVSITLNSGEGYCAAIECNTFNIGLGSDLSIIAGASPTSLGMYIRDNLIMEYATSISIAFQAGEISSSAGIFCMGTINVSDRAELTVVGTTESDDGYGIECAGSLIASADAIISVSSGGTRAGIVSYGAVVDYGAKFNTEIEALAGIHTFAHVWENATYDSDEEGHWLVCECGHVGSFEYHDWINAQLCYDDEAHWLVCECGTSSETEAHFGEDSCACGFVKE